MGLSEIDRLRQQRKKAEGNGQLKEVARISNLIGESLKEEGNYEEAIEEHQLELQLSEALEDYLGAGIAHRKIGELYGEQHNYEKALYHQRLHLSLAEQEHSTLEQQRAHATIGRTYLMQVQESFDRKLAQKAVSSFTKSTELCESLKTSLPQDEYMEIKERLLLNFGLIHDLQQDFDSAVRYIQKAIQIAEKFKFYEDLYRCHVSLAEVYIKRKDKKNSLKHVDSGVQCARKLKDKKLEAETLVQKAMVHLESDDVRASRKTLLKAHKMGGVDDLLQIIKAVVTIERTQATIKETSPDDHRTLSTLYERIADSYSHPRIMRYNKAFDNYKRMLHHTERGDLGDEALQPVYSSLAQTCMDIALYTEAISYYRQEVKCLERINKYEELSRSYNNIASAQERDGAPLDDIMESYDLALKHAERADSVRLQVTVLKNIKMTAKAFKDSAIVEKTEADLNNLMTSRSITEDDIEDDSQEPEAEEENDDSQSEIDIGELSDSDDSVAEEEFDRGVAQSSTQRRARTKRVNFKRNELGEYPLHRSCIQGNYNKSKELLQQGHPVNARDFCGWLPLHEACNHGFTQIVELLLDHGASINDRGGEKCNGTTPLIDACNAGQMDVVRVLLDHKANVIMKDDDGNTALDCLLDYKSRSVGSLSAQDVTDVAAIEQTLRQRMADAGVAIRKTVLTQSNTDNIRSTQRTSRRAAVSQDTPEEWEEDSEDWRPNPVLEDDQEDDVVDDPSLAPQAYRDAIKNVGSVLQRKKKQPTSRDHIEVEEVPALLTEEENIGDGWLIDDIRPQAGKRKRAPSDLLTTKGSRLKRSKGDHDGIEHRVKQSQKPKRVERELNINAHNSDDSDIGGVGGTQFHNRAGKPISFSDSDDSVDVNQDAFRPLENLIETDDSPVNSQNNRSMAALSQSIGMGNYTQPTLSQFLREKTVGNLEPLQTGITTQGQSGIAHPIQAGMMLSVSGSKRIRVTIKDKTLMVPVAASDQNKTISWLCEQASLRYKNMFHVKPILSLSTKEGAMLAPDDVIDYLGNNEEVIGDIASWDLPPISERYTESCSALQSQCYTNIKQALQDCAESLHLSLANLCLKSTQFHPVTRALHCQASLTHIDLAGNCIGNEGISMLCKALPTVPSITSLNLRCNTLSAKGILTLSDSVIASLATNEKMLTKLTTLDLSYNSIGDKSAPSLLSLFTNLPTLVNIKLAQCQLTAEFCTQNSVLLKQGLQHIHSLDLSHNTLGSPALDILLQSLPMSTVTSLSLAAVTRATSETMEMLCNYITCQGGTNIRELVLDDWRLQPEHCEVLCRMLSHSPKLQSISLQNNPALKNTEFENLLLASMKLTITGHVESINFLGCGLATPLSVSLIDAINDKLFHQAALRSLKFSCSRLSSMDETSLRELWTNRWQNSAECVIKRCFVNLTVKQYL